MTHWRRGFDNQVVDFCVQHFEQFRVKSLPAILGSRLRTQAEVASASWRPLLVTHVRATMLGTRVADFCMQDFKRKIREIELAGTRMQSFG